MFGMWYICLLQRGHAYWTDWNARGLFRVNKKDGSNYKVLGVDFFGGLNDIKYFGSDFGITSGKLFTIVLFLCLVLIILLAM